MTDRRSGMDGREASPGVVIPTIDEAQFLPGILEDLSGFVPSDRIVVVDGGSTDDTLRIAAAAGVHVLRTPPGRARQMNAGAEILGTPWLLFLHADSRIPNGTRVALQRWLTRPPSCEAGYFRFALREDRWYRRILERGQEMRERLVGLAYGDQGLIISRRRFLEIGGFPDLPIMEDVEIIRRLRAGSGVERIDAPLPTSSRRYDREGPIRGWCRNALLLTLYFIGVRTAVLARLYRPGSARLAVDRGAGPIGAESGTIGGEPGSIGADP